MRTVIVALVILSARLVFASGSSFQVLDRSLDDPSYRVRLQAAQRLGMIHAWQRAIPMLQRALTDEHEAVRAMAAHSLSSFLEHDVARQALELARRDPSELVREQAEKSLARYHPAPILAAARIGVTVNVSKSGPGVPPELEHELLEAVTSDLRQTPRVALGTPGGLTIETSIKSVAKDKRGGWTCEVAYSVTHEGQAKPEVSKHVRGEAPKGEGQGARGAVLAAAHSINWAPMIRSQP
jgi:hypothetical protein